MIKEFILKKTVFKKRFELISKKQYLYKTIQKNEKIIEYQIQEFNKTWNYCINNIPFYKQWQKKHNLPSKVNSIKELKSFPYLTKKDIHENYELILSGLEDYHLISTGGTSGITTHFPSCKKTADNQYANSYLGRSWWNIKPFDNILMFWGHSHLFGKGYKRYIYLLKRLINDYLINTVRISSYSLSSHNIQKFYKSIKKYNPDTIISYSSNIFKICKFMERENFYINNSKMKGIILTSETVTQADIDIIYDRLNVKVINEYGMAETGPIAYSYNESNNIKVFWDSFIITSSSEDELIISTIGENKFPLINYTSEDKIDIKYKYKESVLNINSVEGKVRNILNIRLTNNESLKISTIFFDHVLKYYPDIYSIQYRQEDIEVYIYIASYKNIDINDLEVYMRQEIEKEFLDIDYSKIKILQIEDVEKTIAGKHRTFI